MFCTNHLKLSQTIADFVDVVIIMFLSKRFTTYKFNSQISCVKNSELPNRILNDLISEFRYGTEIASRKYRTAHLIPSGQVVQCFRLFGVARRRQDFFLVIFFFLDVTQIKLASPRITLLGDTSSILQCQLVFVYRYMAL